MCFSSSVQLPLVWLPMPWAMIPHRPLPPVDLTTACLSLCPTCNWTKAPKLVDIGEMFNNTNPSIYLSLWISESCVSCFPSVSVLPLFNPHVHTTLCVSHKSASWWGDGLAGSEATTCDSRDGRQVHHQHAQRHHASYTPHPGSAGQER